jgi:transposase InsO family protein
VKVRRQKHGSSVSVWSLPVTLRLTLTIISDNGTQFITRKFKEFISIAGMTRDRSSCLENPHFAEEESSLTKNATSHHLGLSQPTLGRGK